MRKILSLFIIASMFFAAFASPVRSFAADNVSPSGDSRGVEDGYLYGNAYYSMPPGNMYNTLLRARNTSIESCEMLGGTFSIAAGAFEGCSRLKSISIPYSVRSLGEGAFSGCTALESVSIEEAVLSVGDGAFSGCTSIKELILSSSDSFVPSEVFSDSKGSVVTVKDKGTAIPEKAY